MFVDALDIVITGVTACFGWFDQLISHFSGAWSTLFTLFVIFVIVRFLLGPALGVSFGVGSDHVKRFKAGQEFRRSTRENYREMTAKKGKFER